MAFFKRSKYDERADNSAGLAPLAVLVIIIILVGVNLITHIPLYLESLLIPVQHPLIYKFPKYDELLHQVVQGEFVDYAAMKKSKLLDEAVSDLSHVSPDDLEDQDQRLCFWINSYNLLVLKAISEKYPLIRIDKEFSRMDFQKYFVGGKSYSLKTIHDHIIVPRIYNKPTALFLICNGAIGSPPLLNHVITPKNIDSDAEKAAHSFCEKPENVLYDFDHKTLALSPFFEWNENLFRGYGGPNEFANKYLPPNRQLDLGGRYVLFKTFAKHFNWYLNDLALQRSDGQSESKVETGSLKDEKAASNKAASGKAAIDKSASDKSASDKSTIEKPASDKPASDKPVSDKAATNAPDTATPANDKSATNKPATAASVTEKSTTNQQTTEGKDAAKSH